MSSTPSPSRSELLTNAVLFLTDPKVRLNSSLQSKIDFLSTKGLTEKEIEQSFARAGAENSDSETLVSNPGSGAGNGDGREGNPGVSRQEVGYDPYGAGVRMVGGRPELPRRDWRDLFVRS